MEAEAEPIALRMMLAVRDEVEEFRAVRDPALAAEVRAHALDHVHAFIRAARTQTPPCGEELDFVRERGARRARELMPLDALLESYLIGQRTMWEAIVDAAGDSPEGLLAARELTAFTFRYTHAINSALAESYQRESAPETDRGRRDVLERLLAGGDPGAQADTLGLRIDADYVVIVAEHDDDMRFAARALEQLDPFVVARHDEVVALARVYARRAPCDLRAALERQPRPGFRAGISTVCALTEVGRGYAEARRALRHANPVAALEEIALFDYLAEAADETAQRLLPPGMERVAPLADTLHAYAECDLNVARTAERLEVHANTVHYRLRRVHELTGRDPRRFADLVELTTALRLIA